MTDNYYKNICLHLEERDHYNLCKITNNYCVAFSSFKDSLYFNPAVTNKCPARNLSEDIVERLKAFNKNPIKDYQKVTRFIRIMRLDNAILYHFEDRLCQVTEGSCRSCLNEKDSSLTIDSPIRELGSVEAYIICPAKKTSPHLSELIMNTIKEGTEIKKLGLYM